VSKVSITKGYFTQIMGNIITAGGILADARLTTNPLLVNTDTTVNESRPEAEKPLPENTPSYLDMPGFRFVLTLAASCSWIGGKDIQHSVETRTI
jgi:hypothetical protein